MNQFITPLAIQNLCSFITGIIGIFINIVTIGGLIASPLAGLSQQIVPSTQSLLNNICFVIVSQATNAAAS